jgi:hypothetical protein
MSKKYCFGVSKYLPICRANYPFETFAFLSESHRNNHSSTIVTFFLTDYITPVKLAEISEHAQILLIYDR